MVEKKRFDSFLRRKPVETAKVTAEDLPGVPVAARSSLNEILNDLYEFPTLFAEASQFPREDNQLTRSDITMMKPIFEMPLFRFDDPLYTPIYGTLTEKMKSSNSAEAHLAYVVSYVAFAQMFAPFDKTHFYNRLAPEDQAAVTKVRNTCHNRPVKKSEEPALSLRRAMDTYAKGFVALPTRQPETAFFQQAIQKTQLSQLFTSGLYTELSLGLRLPLHDAISEGLTKWRDYMLRSLYAADVLLEGRMPWLETPMQLGILLNHQERLLEDGADHTKFDTSRQYFLKNEAVQKLFWQNMQLLQEERIIATHDNSGLEGYAALVAFGHDREQFERFLATIPEGIRADKKLFGRAITELTYLMSVAKTEGRDTDVMTSVLTKAALGSTLRSQVEPVLQIATDSRPGVLFRTNKGVVAGAIWYPEAPKAKTDPGTVLYESTAPPPPVVVRDVSSPTFVREEKPQIITDGMTTSAYWGEVRTLGIDAQAQLLAHIGEQLAYDQIQQERLLELAVQERSPEALPHAMVVPPLLDTDHPLGVLQNVGIMGIERKGNDVAIIINPIASGVETSSPGNIILSGVVTDEGNVAFNEALPINAQLDTALTAVVNLTYQTLQQPEQRAKMAQRQERLRQRLAQWNGNNQNPHVTADGPTGHDCGVIIPLSATDGFVYTIHPQITR